MATRLKDSKHQLHPFRRAFLRGLGVVLPPILTVVILLWIANSIQKFVLSPVETLSRHAIVLFMDDTRTADPNSQQFQQLSNNQFVPAYVYEAVQENALVTGDRLPPPIGRAYYHRYVQTQVLRKSFVIPVFTAGFILAMYLLGKFLAAGLGRFMWNSMERIINQLPLVRSVYSSVKQVTDFFFGESPIEFTRVVAVEYPRRGVWSLGFVTGESMAVLRNAAAEPVISILMPTSPVPGTGFTITVRKSETIDIDIPIDQALQFVVSCGVVVPDGELQQRINTQIAEATATAPVDGNVMTSN